MRTLRPVLPLLAFNAALVAATAFHAPKIVMIPIWIVGGAFCLRAWRSTPKGFERRWLLSWLALAVAAVALLELQIVPGRPLRLTLVWLFVAALVAIMAPLLVLLVRELVRVYRLVADVRAQLKQIKESGGTVHSLRPPD
jgi:hypothetical protein